MIRTRSGVWIFIALFIVANLQACSKQKVVDVPGEVPQPEPSPSIAALPDDNGNERSPSCLLRLTKIMTASR